MDQKAHINKPPGSKNTSSQGVFFQPKLTVNQPNDVYEQEADTMADKVIRMADPSLNTGAFFKPNNNAIQRKCQACEEEEKHVHRKENNEAEVQGNHELDSYVGNLGSSGEQMPESSRKFFEPRFGHDFSNVKLHTDSVAAKSATSINALAYTTGNNIVFNSGQYSPESESGKKLIAHELTHVLQQTGTVQRKPACSYDGVSNEITGVGEEVKYLKALPGATADNFPGEPVRDGDKVVVKNDGKAGTYNSIQNCTWAWVEVPGKKSTDKNYPVLHGFIEGRYLKSTVVKEEKKEKKTDPTPTSIRIAETENGKRTDEKGKEAEDLQCGDYADGDVKDIVNFPEGYQLADKTDAELFTILRSMGMTYFSTGDMKINNTAMIDHFQENKGTDYSNPILTQEVLKHPTTQAFITKVKILLSEKIKNRKGDMLKPDPAKPDVTKDEVGYHPYFNTPTDTLTGLTFAVNDTWANTVDLTRYNYVDDANFSGTLKIVIYDHFGLDLHDVKKYPLDGFVAWFILQHNRGYKPFVTVIDFEVPFDQGINKLKAQEIEAQEEMKSNKFRH